MKRASIFETDGIPSIGQSLPLALQHVVAMIVGCVTPAIIIANTVSMSGSDRIVFIQAALVVSAVATLIQLFPFGPRGFRLGSGLPVMMGVSFAYLASMQAIASESGVAAIMGAQIVGGIVAVLVGLFITPIRKLFPPMITGTVIFTIGLSLYPTAIQYMAGGVSSPDYGSWQNWLIATLTLIIVTVLNHFGRGIIKLASILIGMAVGYIVAIPFGLVSLDAVGTAGVFQLPDVMHFGIDFEVSACTAIGVLFAINAIQAIGDFSATTVGGLGREVSTKELRGGIIGSGIANILGSFIGGLSTATYSQNVGIVTTTKVVNRYVLGLGAIILLIAGIMPKFSAILTTIPQCVLGGATVSVFASIAMTGMKLVTSGDMNYRNTSIVGLSAALGVGISQASSALASFPDWVMTTFGKSPVVLATLVAVLLNVILPKDKHGADADSKASTESTVGIDSKASTES